MSTSDTTVRRGLIRQGDLVLVPVADIRDRGRILDRGTVFLGAAEPTGHAHRIRGRAAEVRSFDGRRYLIITGDRAVPLTHKEHVPVLVSPGTWEVRRHRKWVARRHRKFVLASTPRRVAA